MKTNTEEIKDEVCELYFKRKVPVNEICKLVDAGFVYVISCIHHYKPYNNSEHYIVY
ncbi:hypothetical protein [Legionella shakespearei]|uniref:Transposase n=1 Tax=Legionella shakespearei DSM 23087 TaxID=1122169 RepID=A0A0W0YTA4_9GAMM|nr:hypothetical protein [Legionella shakespearei]KTD59935.1 hypothetical protein Lsha_1685 [Legionella shakespearei DSM 23087]